MSRTRAWAITLSYIAWKLMGNTILFIGGAVVAIVGMSSDLMLPVLLGGIVMGAMASRAGLL